MNHECSIIRDLLPLYAEEMVSPDTASFVAEHLNTCAECRSVYERVKEPEQVQMTEEAAPLIALKRRMLAKRIQTIALTVVFAAALFLSAFAYLSAPAYFAYSEDLFTVTKNGDHSITITFDERVTDYRCDRYTNPAEEGRSSYHIEAWTTVLDSWYPEQGVHSITIPPEESLTIYYGSNNHEADVCIYGQPVPEESGAITLPRLTLNYYLLLAALAFAVLLAVWFAVKRKPKVRIWVERILLFPVSYVIGHLIVCGLNTATYSMTRDFFLILFLSLLLYCGLLLAHSIVRLRREIRDMSK